MRLQIKTLNQRSLLIDIDGTKTVYDLKKELAMYSDVGVQPEYQKLIYAGKILTNAERLADCSIDTKKFLVVMILKHPVQDVDAESPSTSQKNVESTKTPTETKTTTKTSKEVFKTPSPITPAAVATAQAVSKSKSKTDEMVQNIVSMGYDENEVRRALTASFNNPERAIEYLIEGIPTSPSTPEGGTDYAETDADYSMSPFEIFRSDPLFRNLRQGLQQNPALIDEAIQRVGETNPSILNLIHENQQEFLRVLIESSDGEEDDEED